MKTIFKIAISLIFLYVFLCSLLFIFQRELLYHPAKEKIVIEPHLKQYGGEFSYNVNDLELKGHLFPPLKENGYLFIYFHGNAHHAGSRFDDISIVMNEGHGFFMPGYPAYGENEGELSKDVILNTARASITAILKTGLIKEDKIILTGESLGTGVATQMATEFNSAGLILKSPYYSLSETAKYHYPIFPVETLLKDKFEVGPILNQVDEPLFIAHGGKDRVIPLSQALKSYEAHQGKKQMMTLETSHHNDIYWQNFYPQAIGFINDANEKD